MISDVSAFDVESHFKLEGEQTARIFRTLAKSGWYPDLDWWSGQAWHLAQALESGSRDSADEAMCMYVDARINAFEDSLSQKYPSRARFISDGLGAHRDGKYTLSVPVLLLQADGICMDTLKTHLCKVESGKLKIAQVLGKLPLVADHDGGSFAPLLEIFPIAWGKPERDKAGEDVFNRHVVLHGESLDYDTRTRSSQAVMLLNYVGAMMQHAAQLQALT
jgi:hypothetical protein